MEAEFIAECRYLVAKFVAEGLITMPEKTKAVAFRSKYRMTRSPEDEFEFQKKSVASIKRQMAELTESGASADKILPIRIKLGMANSRLKKAREAAGLTA
jgi:hypothetical protein